MTNPLGESLATFADKAAFYAAYPSSAAGWDWAVHPGTAPLGSDVAFYDGYILIVCHPKGGRVGPLVLFDRGTDEIHVIVKSITA